MDEILSLRQCLEEFRYDDALLIVGEMEEMAREDKISKIGSFMVILLIHLIKQQAEQRTTRSWDISIRNSLIQVEKTNHRRKAGGTYMNEDELKEAIEENYRLALNQASLEAFGGAYLPKQLAKMFDKEEVIEQAWQLILHGLPDDDGVQ